MKTGIFDGVFQDRNKIFTENPKSCRGLKIYNEKFVRYKNKELRSWNPYRSKLAAAILKKTKIDIKKDFNILYLGAASGTTVSHISDIATHGIIYAVENSPICMKKLINVCEKRTNIIPIFADANHPDRYSTITPNNIDLIYQDISQRNQAEIFIKNIQQYLKKNKKSVIMVKARSIDVSLKPKKAYEQVCKKLQENGLKIHETIDLEPYEKDHAAIIVGV